MSETDFSKLNLNANLLKNLASLNYKSMTPIQASALPHILAGKDVIGKAKTGSGKTAAFGLGILEKIDINQAEIQALILCPTRELADQVAKSIRQLARTTANVKILTITGGMPYGPQVKSLEHGAHIVVGTPGRIDDHIIRKRINLTKVSTFVLDEADRMLAMGFQEELDNIIDHIPRQRQNLLFSATFADQIKRIAERSMNDPLTIEAEETHDDSSIQQHFFKVADDQERMLALRLLLLEHQPQSTVVFCTTKLQCDDIAHELRDWGFSSIALHGDLDQRQRETALVRFANNSISILVATDVAARGLDIEKLDCVINYYIANDFEVHTHRIGRTGRAGNWGLACSLYSNKESHKISELGKFLDMKITSDTLPNRKVLDRQASRPSMQTILITRGKKQKVRPGNILGALTSKGGLDGKEVGKINVYDNCSYVAVSPKVTAKALKKIASEKWKGGAPKAWVIK